jgi:hypothetical protein
MASGRYINGEETERFEGALAKYLGVKHVIGVGNGYDALFLALKALEITDESYNVFVREYTHISTHSSVLSAGAKLISNPEFATNSNRYISVHMNGRMDVVRELSATGIIEDACQAIGASYEGKKAGTFGMAGCFSFHPMKVLGGAGDGGAICTNNSILNERLRDLRNHGGGKGYGVNSRLDNIQAAILNVKLPYLDGFIKRRREIAAIYEAELPEWVKKPPAPSEGPYFDTYSSYVIGGSPELLSHMRGNGIECFSHIRINIVSLPIYPEMKEGHIGMVIAAVKAYA